VFDSCRHAVEIPYMGEGRARSFSGRGTRRRLSVGGAFLPALKHRDWLPRERGTPTDVLVFMTYRVTTAGVGGNAGCTDPCQPQCPTSPPGAPASSRHPPPPSIPRYTSQCRSRRVPVPLLKRSNDHSFQKRKKPEEPRAG
jgi:hypothetical protein